MLSTPFVITIIVIAAVLLIALHQLSMAYMDIKGERDIYKKYHDDVRAQPKYSYSQLLEEVLKSAQPPLSKVDADIQKLVNLAIDPHANYNEASNAAMQACKRLARKG